MFKKTNEQWINTDMHMNMLLRTLRNLVRLR